MNIRPSYWPQGGQPHRTEEFTWIEPNVIAASWWPDPPVFTRYRKESIKVIINCSEFDYRSQCPRDFQYYHIDIPDYGVPTRSQVDRFLELCSHHTHLKETIVVHCVAGCGRTGQLLVAWGVKNQKIPQKMDPVKWIRSKRRCCLETPEQALFARKIVRSL